MNHPKVVHPRDVPRKKEPSKFSKAFVVKHAEVLGSVGFAYFCYIMDFILFLSLCQQTYQVFEAALTLVKVEGLVALWVVFIAQTYVQLVALPILQNYQNRQSEEDAIKADVDHQAMTHIAIVSDENKDSIVKVVDQLNMDTAGGLKDAVDTIVTAIKENSCQEASHQAPQ